jgi:hypothetical protein
MEFFFFLLECVAVSEMINSLVSVQQCLKERILASTTEQPSESQSHIRAGCKLFNILSCLVDSKRF